MVLASDYAATYIDELTMRKAANDRGAFVNALMVVAQGKVIKNTFGALEVPDMPLKPDEYLEVKRAMQGY